MLIITALICTTSSYADHKLRIKTDGAATKSLYLVGKDQLGNLNNGFCIQNLNLKPGWFETPFILQDGSTYSVLGFSSRDCTAGLRKTIRDKVPTNDGLRYVWVPLF
ncbi:hypothetical protein [Acinetobacter boissieri]|uniref:Uncharacterized protein n=1 Tax=Acinetobacter boissieri TaxID=1219383 RepID=A0A1G6GR13_9GAMM|nr:hypothetical protein [Acinetobacter boissieri]SDB84175.1 hypothetical protein SAMN05421733_10211 [Acinetobacter boissieri]